MTTEKAEKTTRILATGMGALGALIGVWAALSSSPVVTTALPLIFAVAGGWGGFSLLNIDLEKVANRRKIELVGASLAALCFCCLISLFATLAFQPKLIAWVRPPAVKVDVSTNADPISAVALRAKLSALGASKIEQEAILNRQLAQPDYDAFLTGFNDAATKYVAAYEKFSPQQREVLAGDEIIKKMVTESYQGLKAARFEIDALRAKYQPKTITQLLLTRIEALQYFNGTSTSDDVEAIIRTNPDFMAARAEMFAVIIPARGDALKTKDIVNAPSLDETIKLISAMREAQLGPDNGKLIAKEDFGNLGTY